MAARSLEKRFQGLTKKWDIYWTRLGIEPLEVGLGCGINTGSSLVGTLGTATREQFTGQETPGTEFAVALILNPKGVLS
jgi:hypothetical protein